MAEKIALVVKNAAYFHRTIFAPAVEKEMPGGTDLPSAEHFRRGASM